MPGLRGRVAIPGVYAFETSHTDGSLRETPVLHAASGRRADSTGRPRPRPRVVFAGDSFTYGLGVDDEETFASVVATRLPHDRVLNAGVPGTGPDHVLRHLSAGAPYGGARIPAETDLLVLVVYANDLADVALGHLYRAAGDSLVPHASQDAAAATKARAARVPGFVWLSRHSHVFNLARRVALGAIGAPAGIPAGPYATPERERTLRAILGALRTELHARGTGFLVVYAPSAPEVEAAQTGMPSEDEAAVVRIAGELGLDLVSLTDTLSASGHTVDRLYYPETHWTPRAHAVVGAWLTGEVGRRLRANAATPAPHGSGG